MWSSRYHGLTLPPAWISNYIHGSTVEVWEWIVFSTHTLLGMWLLIHTHTGIRVHPCLQKRPLIISSGPLLLPFQFVTVLALEIWLHAAENQDVITVHALTHWGRVTHICISDLTSIGSDNGLSPGRCQAIIRTNAGILLIRPLGTNFSEILIEILIFSFKKMRLKVSSAKRRPFCLGLNGLISHKHCQWIRFHLNPYMLIFFRGNKKIFTFCVVPRYWRDTGSWNPSSSRTRT